ncbi:alpha/beta fold hydrolase [Aminobacter carboxidus]|uniref:Alpha/beta hydrolase n=1 Tax=Aminobacter carboxidus TaxID=376165 RepID=A0ABR9GL73_9HYPH|nr:alpha/beta hydrolase [Aminobacter carboxidus]MBE1204411.1 alpha/beta hydrolase [Aminobacter carboxidus]
MASETTTRTVRANGVEIVTEAFGDPSAPPMLLIMGAMASMLWWPDAFCRQIAASGRHVIRYDNRDTGLSTKYAPGKPPYTMDDMARDAVAVLDAYGIAKAHVVGMSLGGMIAQILALTEPGRVASLTLVSTTPIGLDRDLPPPTPTYMEHAATGEGVDWSDRAQATGFIAGEARVIASTAHPHDAAKTLAFIERDYDRSGGYLSATNHFMLTGGEAVKGKLPGLNVPFTVIHGTADPIFPIVHGKAITDAVKGSTYVVVDGGGHELHEDDWGIVIPAIVKNSSAPR